MRKKESNQKSSLVSKNVTISGRRTSVRLEPEMWAALKEISEREQCSVHDICSLISLRKNENTSLTAAIRVFLMLYFRASSTEDGHRYAGHGNFEIMKKRARLQRTAGREGVSVPENDNDDELVGIRNNTAMLNMPKSERAKFIITQL